MSAPVWRRIASGRLIIAVVWSAAACAETRNQVPAPGPRRVVSLVPSVTELIVALGAGHRLVGRTRFDTDPRLAELPSVGGTADPSIEAIVALEPDLVLMWRDSTAPRVAGALDRTGIPVHGVSTWTLPDLRATIADLGRLFAVARAADSLVQTIDDSLAAVRASAAGARRVRVLYLLSERPLMTIGAGTFIDEVIDIAGGQNIFHDRRDAWPIVNMEEVLRRDPEVIIVPAYGDDPRPADRLSRAAGWELTTAARSGRVLSVPADLFDRPGPRIVVAARTLATMLRQSRADTSAAAGPPVP